MKKSYLILIILLVLVVAGIIGKNLVVEHILKGGVKTLTGLRMRIAKTEVGILSTKIGLEGLELYNPPDFPDKVMIDMPELYVDYNLGEMIKKNIHIYELRIHLKEFVVVKNKDGKLNLNSLNVVKDTKKEVSQKKKPEADGSFQIDVMKLKIDKVIYKDYTAGKKPKVMVFPIKINEKFTNINDPKKVANVIIVKAIMHTAIANLTNFDVNLLASTATDTLKGATKIVGSTAGMALDTGKKAVGTATGTVTKTKDTIGKVIPLGGKKKTKKVEEKK